jgi:hypothetical protein
LWLQGEQGSARAEERERQRVFAEIVPQIAPDLRANAASKAGELIDEVSAGCPVSQLLDRRREFLSNLLCFVRELVAALGHGCAAPGLAPAGIRAAAAGAILKNGAAYFRFQEEDARGSRQRKGGPPAPGRLAFRPA